MFLAPKEEVYAIMATLRGVAQFGSALVWGTRGRRFKSCHSDDEENRLKSMISGGFYFEHLFVIFRFVPTFVPTSKVYHFLHAILRLVNHRIGDVDVVGKRRLDIAMPHEILEHLRVDSLFCHARGEGVTEVVKGAGYGRR